jgi:hypothetical protein
MAEFAATGDPTQLYTAIEKAYCEDRWSDVLEQGERLLERLPTSDLGLRQRLQLLMAHTHLYGYGNRDAAGDLYRDVQKSQAEPALRQIATQGLQQCDLPAERPGGAATLALTAQTPSVEPQRLREPEPEPEPEPDPSPYEKPRPIEDLPLLVEDGPSLREAALALSRAAASPARPAETPVMPWLESAPTQGGGSVGSGPESLIPDVIDEPEMIEVHQANPALAEELEILESTSASPGEAAEDGDGDLLSGLLRVEIL